ncbi:spindlin interactor and repressor of chromatin-binding protein isoform X2 [Sceloporus undulatus]|uniref:spindlin interactor and repressor of chromatin-binding protein isoform X2 n=1 Tax=Sceloporus undulatus TaxID=8520 RepID=UPI001C4D79D2|nr:spindlin interactor and repressor of chromatin-binding protein isoform X2 [Sceloporus undulatus]
MALKAETPLLDYIEVSSSVLRYKEKEKADAGAVVPDCTRVKRDGASSNATGKGEQLVPSVVPGSGQEEAGSSWRQEYLIAESHGRPVCMVCGSVLSSSGPAAARKHILQQHAHSLDFNLEEKHNILEAWSEGAVLPTVEPQPSLEELLHLDPERRAQGRPRRHNSDSAKDVRSKQSSKVAGKEWLSECGVPGSAPAEIRIFTDGTFPAGFTLKLYCRTQPEPPQDSGVKTDTRKKKTVDRNCSVSLLRLHSTDSPHHLCSSQGATSRPLTSSAGSNAKDCGTRAGQREASAGKEDAALLAKGFNPIWRARFLMDFDTAAGHLVCMVCEYPLRRVCLATVKRHILQCHAETLNLPREVRRTIREVWESRNQSSPPAPKK